MARLLSDVSDLEKLSLIDVSYSRLDTFKGSFFSCEAKYFYTYVLQQREASGAPALLGNVIHDTLEETLEEKCPPLDVLLSEYKAQKEMKDVDSIISEELYTDGINMLKDFVDSHQDYKFSIIDKEKEFSIVVGRGLLSGYIDRVDLSSDGKTIVITDYKTGKKELSKKQIPTNLQLGIYALAISLEYPNKDIYAQLHYLRSDTKKGHHFTSDDLSEVETKLLQLIDRLIETDPFNYTENATICKWCDHAKTMICPVGARRVNP